ncbi:4-hydroxy-tetrahydrodipicolinate synthase [Diplocloster modestus]|uniref:4-hydroxy-tetrahydrodipicolinate synthase n=1 Tax=Diplocloster modestus TaxID=2850322 RepID=A0ABS6KAQ1_9FIRM|nr:4-hydroxy-tetrahydrodipicolinate synthase [Diplocloster modestus]MBU9727608.1 4-hydroxy-tetrahydrodipicolinate synthase [Diplocloster modestus]
MALFEGAGVAIITPFTEDLKVNYDKLGELIDFQIENGTDSIIICGTTGEASAMTHEEHLECIRYTVERVAGRVPVIAGSGSNWTDTAVYLSQEAEKRGADGLLVVSPYYNKATQKGLYAHFKAVADSVKIPIILYNIQGRTGVNIQPSTLVGLIRDVENIVGVKEASGNISQVAKIMSLAQEQGVTVDLYSGNDDQVLPLLSLGGKGVISVLSNVAPRFTHDMVARYMAGDVKGSMEMQLKAIPLIDQLFCEVNPIPVKAAVNMMGVDVGGLRLPLTVMEDAHQINLRRAMEEFGIPLA